jgi:hypothetical protein
VDIYFKGFVFRLYVVIPEWRDREESNRPVLCPPIAVDEFASAHHQAIRHLCSLFPSYSSCVRMVTQWVHTHMLSGYLTVPMIEVLVASVYVGELVAPTTACAGFLRTLNRSVISGCDFLL